MVLASLMPFRNHAAALLPILHSNVVEKDVMDNVIVPCYITPHLGCCPQNEFFN